MTTSGAAIVRRNAWSLGVLATVFGAVIIGCHIESGGQRWSAATWAYALEVPGSPATWGAMALAAGLFIVFGCWREHRRARLVGLWLGAAWFCGLAGAALLAFADDLCDDTINTVNPMSIVAWLAFASMYVLQVRDENGLSTGLGARLKGRMKSTGRDA